jgi:hypothetical protein
VTSGFTTEVVASVGWVEPDTPAGREEPDTVYPRAEAAFEWGWVDMDVAFALSVRFPLTQFDTYSTSDGERHHEATWLSPIAGARLELYVAGPQREGSLAYGGGVELGLTPALFGVVTVPLGSRVDVSLTLRAIGQGGASGLVADAELALAVRARALTVGGFAGYYYAPGRGVSLHDRGSSYSNDLTLFGLYARF